MSREHQRWQVLTTRQAYASSWVEIWVDHVRLPDGRRLDHHMIKFPRASVGAVVVDQHEQTLLLWRHRHITNTWGWEIPAGWADPAEELVDAARREVQEETGYQPQSIQQMTSYRPMAGISTMAYTTFLVTEAIQVGPPTDPDEVARVAWIPLADIPDLTTAGQISDGPSLTALSYYLGIYRHLRPA